MKVTESVETRTVLVPFMCKLSIRPPKRYFIVSCHSGRARPAGARVDRRTTPPQAGLGSFTQNLSPSLLTHRPRHITCQAQRQQGREQITPGRDGG